MKFDIDELVETFEAFVGKTLPGRRYCWRLSRYQKNVKIYEEIQDERLPACQGERSSFGIKVRKAICITSQMR